MTNLTQIQTFIEVAQTGSFAQAGRRLGVPRSTVSARVRALEERLNVRLLHRTTRQVTLTDEGRLYKERCEDTLDRLMAAEDELSRTDRLSGSIRMTVPIDMSKSYLATSLGAFTRRHPSIEIEVIVTDESIDLIGENVDIALRGGSPGAPGLTARRLGAGALELYASPQYLRAKQIKPPLTTLAGHVVFDPTRQGGADLLAGALKGSVKTRNFELAKALAIQSHGLAVLPKSVCAESVETGQLLTVATAAPLPSLALYIVVPTRKHMPMRVRKLIDFLVSDGKEGIAHP